jgi:hypothetical protein
MSLIGSEQRRATCPTETAIEDIAGFGTLVFVDAEVSVGVAVEDF